MKLTKLIEALQALSNENPDIEVFTTERDIYGEPYAKEPDPEITSTINDWSKSDQTRLPDKFVVI